MGLFLSLHSHREDGLGNRIAMLQWEVQKLEALGSTGVDDLGGGVRGAGCEIVWW